MHRLILTTVMLSQLFSRATSWRGTHFKWVQTGMRQLRLCARSHQALTERQRTCSEPGSDGNGRRLGRPLP